MNTSIQSILGDYEGFLERVFSHLKSSGIRIKERQIDHVCYRVETFERYEELRDKLKEIGEVLTEAPVGGRPISTFKLHEPIRYKGQEIYLLELPSPKEGSFYKEGFEHIEIVISENFEDFINKHDDLIFDTKAMSKPVNPDISLRFGEYSVKFHHEPLDIVIEKYG